MAGSYFGAGLVVNNGQKIVRPVVMGVLALLFVKILAGVMAGIHPEGIHIWKRCRAIWPRIEVWLRIRSAGKINGAPVNFQKGSPGNK